MRGGRVRSMWPFKRRDVETITAVSPDEFVRIVADLEVLPVRETSVCPACGWAGVAIRGDVLTCHGAGCTERWRWPGLADG